MTGSWGPFLPNLDPVERRAQLRSLRTALRLLTGERGRVCGLAILRAELDDSDVDLLREASAEFDRLAPLDRRRVLSSFQAVNFAPARPRSARR